MDRKQKTLCCLCFLRGVELLYPYLGKSRIARGGMFVCAGLLGKNRANHPLFFVLTHYPKFSRHI